MSLKFFYILYRNLFSTLFFSKKHFIKVTVGPRWMCYNEMKINFVVFMLDTLACLEWNKTSSTSLSLLDMFLFQEYIIFIFHTQQRKTMKASKTDDSKQSKSYLYEPTAWHVQPEFWSVWSLCWISWLQAQIWENKTNCKITKQKALKIKKHSIQDLSPFKHSWKVMDVIFWWSQYETQYHHQN